MAPARDTEATSEGEAFAVRCACLYACTELARIGRTDPSVIRRILEHIGARKDPLLRAPAPDPPMQQMPLELAAA